jgi:hypothetical protein
MTTQNKWDKRTRDKKEQADTSVHDRVCVDLEELKQISQLIIDLEELKLI